MNRLQSWEELFTTTTTESPPIDGGRFSAIGGRLAGSVFAPMHYEPNYSYPLFVWLHGPGDSDRQLQRIMPLVSLRNYVAIAPRGTEPLPSQSGRMLARWPIAREGMAAATQRILESVWDCQERFNIHARRVFLAGFDSGGTMALRLALAHPEHFAGAMSLGGALPAGGAPLARIKDARRQPLLLSCGRESQVYPSSQVCEDLRLLHSAGMHVTLRIYPCAHEVTAGMLADLDRWMMERITGEKLLDRDE